MAGFTTSLFLSLLVVALASGETSALTASNFPLKKLATTERTRDLLKAGGPAALRVAEDLVNRLLREHFKNADISFSVNPGDVRVEANLPNENIPTGHSCMVRAQLLGPRLVGSVSRQSTFDFAANTTGVFAEAVIHARLEASGRVRARLGSKIFGKCHRIARKTVGISLATNGINHLVASVRLVNFEFRKVDGVDSVVFNLNFGLEGRTVKWTLDDLRVAGCKIKLFNRWRIASFCSAATKRVRNAVNGYLTKQVPVQAPRLIAKLERLVNTAIGTRIVLPLDLGCLLS